MATYLQGVTDYIPEYQPFQPDFNFYGDFLKTKQNQYDSNYKALNNLYGQYFYADLTKDSNIQKKDKLLKQIDFNLKRVAGLDLSLEQNVQQAAQIFTPFYEDKFLMKDMAYTKNFHTQYGMGMGYQSSSDREQSKKYWETGIKDLVYQREAFKRSTDEESLNFANPVYTPYVNAIETYLKIAKDTGISADITETDGRYFIRQKNGDLVLQPLNKLFTSTFANDPALQQVYKVQARVNREDSIRQNLDQFGGDYTASERDYLTKQYATIQEYIKIRNSKNQEDVQAVSQQKDKIDEKLSTGQGNEFTPGYKKSIDEALGIATANANYTQELSSQVSDDNTRTLTTAGSAPNVSDLNVLRFQVDAGVASMLAEQDINEAAYIFSRKDMVKSMSANPYGVAAANHQYALQRQQLLLDAKDKKDKENLVLDAGLKNGTYIGLREVVDPQTGEKRTEGIPNPALFNRQNKPGKNAGGGATDRETNILLENELSAKDLTKDYADGMVRTIVNTINGYIRDGRMTAEQAADYFFSTSGTLNPIRSGKGKLSTEDIARAVSPFAGARSPKDLMNNLEDNRTRMTPSQFFQEYQKDPSKFLSERGSENLINLYQRVTQYALATKGDAGISESFLKNPAHDNFNKYLNFIQGKEVITNENQEVLVKNLSSSGIMQGMNKDVSEKLANLMINSDLSLMDRDAFIQMGQNYLPNRSVTGGGYGWKDKAKNSLTASERQQLEKNLAQLNSQTKKQAGAVSAPGYPNLTPRQVSEYESKFLEGKFGLGLGRGKDAEDILGSIYDDAEKEYRRTVQNGKEFKSFSGLLDPNKANAVYNTTENGYQVNPNTPATPGFAGFVEFVNSDMSKINFYDTNKNAVSFYGTSKGDIQKTLDQFSDSDDITRHVKAADLILNEYYKTIGKKDAKTFGLFSVQVAAEDRNKGAMVLYPTMDVLKTLMATDDGGVLTQDMVNAIATNGISFISNRSNFTNSIFKGNQWTPMQALINARGSYDYEDPMGGGSYTIQKDDTGISDYSVTVKYRQRNSDGSVSFRSETLPPTQYGNNVDNIAIQAQQILREQATYNQEVWQKFHSPNSQNSLIFRQTPESTFNR
jgi:hypothetical protein